MASVLAGFRPVKHMNGSPYNGQVNRYMFAAGDGGGANVGDLVMLGAEAALEDAAGGVYPVVKRVDSATSAPVIGAIVGFEVDYTNLTSSGVYRAASTRRVALVADSPDLIFACPQDGTGGVVAAASVGLNCSLTLGSAATTAPWASTMKVDSSEVDTTATDPVQIVGILASPDNNITSTARPAELLVRINTHAFNAAGLAGV